MTGKQIAGDDLSSLCESVQDAVNEVIRVCREHGVCRRTFADLNISVMAIKVSDSIQWSIVSLITDKVTMKGVVK